MAQTESIEKRHLRPSLSRGLVQAQSFANQLAESPDVFSGWSGLPSFDTGTTTVQHHLVHEVGTSETVESLSAVHIQPSLSKTTVRIKSTILNRSAAGPASDEYQATIRRRKARGLKDAVARLSSWQTDDDFCIRTSCAFDKAREAIRDLISAKSEGNSRAILRYVRDTFLDGGWEKYRDSAVRKAVESVLDELASEVEIIPSHVKASRAKLEGVGLQPFPIGNLMSDQEPMINGTKAD